MTAASVYSRVKEAQDRYSMYRVMSGDADAGDAKFLFSADDNLVSKDMETCAGSRILEGYFPAWDAAAIAKMRAAGGKLVGKTNIDEFGFGSFGVNSAFGTPLNPFDAERVCGGSSAGSACAAAVLDGHVSIGVSTGGSISNSAAFCGIYGMTPTYGRVSRNGVIDHAASMDRVGVLSADASRLMDYIKIISGRDTAEPTSCAQPELNTDRVKVGSVAVPNEAVQGLSKDVESAFNSAVEGLRTMGIDVDYVDMPVLKYTSPAYTVISSSEACTNLARFVGMRYGRQDGDLSLKFDDYFTSMRTPYFGEEAKRRILLGTFLKMGKGAEKFAKAGQVRQNLIAAYNGVLEDHDAVLTPTMPFTAPRIEDARAMSAADAYASDRLTVPACIAGMPCVSVPCGYGSDGMPVGMQFMAGHWQENVVCSAAEAWSEAFEAKRPEVIA